jgi:N6-adenosine-specific RNA methylase IME4
MTATERQRKWRRTIAREKKLANPKLKEKQGRRAEREAALGARIRALPNRRYGVILADPEWRFEPWSRETGLDRAADNHFSTSFTAIIKARPVEAIAAKDCVLFLWSTVPMFIAAHEVMAA